MTEHTRQRIEDGYIIETRTTDWLTVVWTLTVGPFDLAVKCHTVGRDGIANEDGLAVLPVDAESVRLEAM